jgi:hypothetical protein
LVWENGADFEAALLNDWDSHIEELTESVKSWKTLKI